MPLTGRNTLGDKQKTSVGFIQKSVQNTITAAAGGGKANAVLLTAGVNRITTVATAADSVRLPVSSRADIGLQVEVIHDGANSAQIFGSASDTIDGVATATGVPLAAAKRCVFTLISYASGVGAWVSNAGAKAS